MDHAVQGHGYAKAPFDAACWDLLGQACSQPVWMLLGGKLTDGAPMYRVAPQNNTEETLAEMARYRAQGYRQFQIKVGADWTTDAAIDKVSFRYDGTNYSEAVHEGFRDGYRSVEDQLNAVLDEWKAPEVDGARVYFTGHSLGGALATLASLDQVEGLVDDG